MSVGILAYGSLIEDPGLALASVTERRIDGVLTPFSVEFARSSRTRGGAPTLVPVETEGSRIRGSVLVLMARVGIERAQNILYSREIRADHETSYRGDGDVRIEQLVEFAGIGTVLYVKLRANIQEPTPTNLAELAIRSVSIAEPGLDGISYLIGLREGNIETSLMREYEAEVLRITVSADLRNALETIRNGA